MTLLDPTQLVTGLILMSIGAFVSAVGTAVWHLYRKVAQAFSDLRIVFNKVREIERKIAQGDNDEEWGEK